MTKNIILEDDKALFQKAMQDVKPLKKNKKITEKNVSLPQPIVKKTTIQSKQTIKNGFTLSNYSAELVHADEILSFCRSGFPAQRFKDLKNGKIAWQARLDLHGFTSVSAEHAFKEFITKTLSLQHRCILIIHGKGSLQHEAPVLKNLINAWLPQIKEVLAYHSALPQHGGNGAVYVFLKRTLLLT